MNKLSRLNFSKLFSDINDQLILTKGNMIGSSILYYTRSTQLETWDIIESSRLSPFRMKRLMKGCPGD